MLITTYRFRDEAGTLRIDALLLNVAMTDTFVREELEALLTLCCLSNNSMVVVCVAFYERVALFVLVRTRILLFLTENYWLWAHVIRMLRLRQLAVAGKCR
jgi:hypothetical protein